MVAACAEYTLSQVRFTLLTPLSPLQEQASPSMEEHQLVEDTLRLRRLLKKHVFLTEDISLLFMIPMVTEWMVMVIHFLLETKN